MDDLDTAAATLSALNTGSVSVFHVIMQRNNTRLSTLRLRLGPGVVSQRREHL
jgi:hypothetical protein